MIMQEEEMIMQPYFFWKKYGWEEDEIVEENDQKLRMTLQCR